MAGAEGVHLPRFIWPDRLDLSPRFLLLLLKAACTGATICLDPVFTRPLCLRILRMLERLRVPIRIRIVTLRMDREGALGPHEIEDHLHACVSRHLQMRFDGQPPLLLDAVRSFLSLALYARIRFVAMVKAATADFGPALHEIHLRYHLANGPLRAFCLDQGFRVSQSPYLAESLRFAVRPILDLARGCAGSILKLRPRGNIDPEKSSLWIEYENNLFPASRSLLFWRPHVREGTYDIVCYLDRDNTPPTPERLEWIGGHGCRWIDFRRPASFSRFSASDVMWLLKTLLAYDRRAPWWFHFFRFKFHLLRCIHRSVYRSLNVKLLIQHQEGSWTQAAQAMALEDAGAIMVGSHWSNYSHHNVSTHLHPQHAYFVWGKVMLDTLRKKGHACRHVLPCGVWMKPDRTGVVLGDRLRKGRSFILAIFDSSVDVHYHQSPARLAFFYERVLSLLEEHSTWAGVAKRKGPGMLRGLRDLPGGDGIVERMLLLQESGRVVFLDHSLSPVTAFMAADLSVCFGFSTVGIIAGAYGRRAVHWDCSGYTAHPLYREKGQQVLFRSLEDFAGAITRAGLGDRRVGDFSRWARDFNCFMDDRAPERVGNFIQRFMTEVVATGDAAATLDRCVARYMRENRVGREFADPSNWWDRETSAESPMAKRGGLSPSRPDADFPDLA